MSIHVDGPTLTLVVNPTAGRGRARRLLPKVTAALLAGIPDANLRIVQTGSYAEARLRCIAAVAQAREPIPGRQPDSLLVMGGDGMMHLGINACAGTSVPLGVLPAGTGNDFARGIGVPQNALQAISNIVSGSVRAIDLMSVSGKLVDGGEHRWVGSIVSTGFDGRVNYRTNKQSWSLGGLVYAWAALAELSQFEPLPYRLTVDGVVREQAAMFIAVGNAGWFGGGMHVCPTADVTDGLLDITVIHPVSRMTLLRLLPTMYYGGFVKDPAVEMLRAREVIIDGNGLYGMADGEELGAVPLQCKVVPAAMQVYAPTVSYD